MSDLMSVELFDLPSYAPVTTAMPDYSLGKIVRMQTGEQFDFIDVLPLGVSTARSYWEDGKSICESPDGQTGNTYGDCNMCQFRSNGCRIGITALVQTHAEPDDPDDDPVSNLGLLTFNVRPSNSPRMPRNYALYRALVSGAKKHEPVRVEARREGNKAGSLYWTTLYHNEVAPDFDVADFQRPAIFVPGLYMGIDAAPEPEAPAKAKGKPKAQYTFTD